MRRNLRKQDGKGSRMLAGLLVFALMTVLLGACGQEENGGSGSSESQEESSGAQQASDDAGKEEAEPDRHHVEITIKDYGKITLELYREAAPVTVDNFLKLAGDGFYDGLTFHRIIKDFMMQGGDPEGTGYGGAEEMIKGEFSKNGVENSLSHTRGAISMARSSSYDSASSQFFIVHKDSVYLDGEYACFGYVTEGIEVVDAVCEDAPVSNDGGGFVPMESQPVIESIKVID